MRGVLGGLVFLLLIAPMGPTAAAEEEAKPKVREVAAWRAREVEKARYGWIAPFWKKHAAVNKDGRCTSAARCEGGKWGYYGPAGKPGLEPQFDAPGVVSDAGAVVRIGGKLGFVTWEGKLVVEARHNSLTRLDSGYFTGSVAGTGAWVLLDPAGRLVFTSPGEIVVHQEKLLWASRNDRWGAYDFGGKAVVPHRFQEVYDLGNGLVSVRAGSNWALFDGAGKQLTPLTNNNFEYGLDEWFPFNHGGTCDSGMYSCEGGRYGVMHRSGRIVVPARYDCVNVFDFKEDGVELVVVSHDRPVGPDSEERCSGGKWQLLKGDGTPFSAESYAFIEPFYGLKIARFAVGGTCDSDGNCTGSRWGLLDRAGRQVAKPVYDWLNQYDDLPMAFVREGKWGFIGGDLTEVVGPKYEMLHVDDRIIRFREGGKWGVMEPSGRILVPPKYEMILPFGDGRARFMENGKWGLMDATGKVLAKASYAAICSPRSGTYLFSQSAGCGLKQGKDLLEQELALPSGKVKLEGALNPDCACDGATFGLLGPDGREVLPAKYAMIQVTSALLLSDVIDWKLPTAPVVDQPKGQVWVRINKGGACNRAFICKGGAWGLADLTGRIIVKPAHACLEPQADFWFTFASGGSCEVHGTRVETCTPETKWGLMKLEPVGK